MIWEKIYKIFDQIEELGQVLQKKTKDVWILCNAFDFF